MRKSCDMSIQTETQKRKGLERRAMKLEVQREIVALQQEKAEIEQKIRKAREKKVKI